MMRRLLIGACALALAIGAWTTGHAQRITNQVLAATVTATGTLTASGPVVFTATSQTVADSGDGNPASGTITYTTGVHLMTCSDTHGCAMTLSETGTTAGNVLIVVNVSANAITFADSAGVQIVPASSCSVAQHGVISFVYGNSQWQVLSHTATCS